MAEKIKCGDGPDCKNCQLCSTIQTFTNQAIFTRNTMNRCDWYSKIDPIKGFNQQA